MNMKQPTKNKRAQMSWDTVKAIASGIMLVLLVVAIVSLPEKAWSKIPETLDKIKGTKPSLTEQQKKGFENRYHAGVSHFNQGTKEGYGQAKDFFEQYLLNIDQIIAAEQDSEKKLKLIEQKNDAQFKLAQSFQALGEKFYGRAIQEYEKFIRLFPSDIKRSDAKANIATIYEAMGNVQAAQDIRDELLDSGNKITSAKEAFKQGNYYTLVIKDYTKALEYYQQGLTINDGNVPNYSDMPASETLQNMIIAFAENTLYTDARHFFNSLKEAGYEKEAEELVKKYPKLN